MLLDKGQILHKLNLYLEISMFKRMQATTKYLTALGVVVLTAAISQAQPALAVYIALGDSITFGETDLQYIPSFGDRGYVGLYADYLASVNGGDRPTVINLARRRD